MRSNRCNCIMALFLTVILFQGCNPGSKHISENDIKFNTIRVDKTYHLLENPENPNCNLQIQFVYPEKYTDAAILARLQEGFILSYFGEPYRDLTPQEAVEQYEEDYLKNYKSLEEDFKSELTFSGDTPVSAWFSYYEMSANDIIYNKGDILSYTITYESYTGGAHGAHSTINEVLNLATGEPIPEEEIFIDNYQDRLAEILVDQIAKQNQVADPKELENMGFFSIDEIYPNGNFLVDEEGITYDFNEYEIAAYVVGTIHVELPYSTIRHLLRNNSPVSYLIDK